MKNFFLTLAVAALSATACSSQAAEPAKDYTVTTVHADSSSPTGYSVTFCYPDDGAVKVSVQGEWIFSALKDASIKTATNASPFEWENGYTVWGTERSPYYDLKLNKDLGTWQITLPLPSGTYKYKFYVDGQEKWDPANPPLNRGLDAPDLKSPDRFSTVYVPYDPVKQSECEDRSLEAPLPGRAGEVFYREIPSSADGRKLKFGVYLPYGYEKDRAEAYPVLVLFHGGGDTEASWFINGLANILDNLYAQGLVAEPMVVLTPNGSDFRGGLSWDREAIDDMVINDILPYAVENFNCSPDPKRRAFAGLSMGGATTMYTLINHPEEFQYYMAMSAPLTPDIVLDFSNPVLKEKKICLAVGMYDFVKVEALLNPQSSQARGKEGSYYSYIFGLYNAGVPFETLPEYPHGHEWTLWRLHISDFVGNVLWR